MLPTFIRGFSDAAGSWKMICISRRNARKSRLFMAVTSRFSNFTSPLVGSIKRRMHRPAVDLPQPDSPTSPRVSPRKMSNVTLSTARIGPSSVGKCLTSDRTLTSESPLWFSVAGMKRFAALPPHIAVRLCLTATMKNTKEARPPLLRRSLSLVQDRGRKGEAFPQCAAAKPQPSLDRKVHIAPSLLRLPDTKESRLHGNAACDRDSAARSDSRAATPSVSGRHLRLSANVPV